MYMFFWIFLLSMIVVFSFVFIHIIVSLYTDSDVEENERSFTRLVEALPHGYQIYDKEGNVLDKSYCFQDPYYCEFSLFSWMRKTVESFFNKRLQIIDRYDSDKIKSIFPQKYSFLFSPQVYVNDCIFCTGRQYGFSKEAYICAIYNLFNMIIMEALVFRNKKNWIMVFHDHRFNELFVIARDNWKYYTDIDFSISDTMKDDSFEFIFNELIKGKSVNEKQLVKFAVLNKKNRSGC